jgi:hypothetical protein
MNICKIINCSNNSLNSRGWCSKHYMKWYRYGDPLFVKPSRGKTPTSITWSSMKQRCDNPNSPDYPRYGGRGIKYDESWQTLNGFISDMGERPVGMTLDRIDNTKGYYKENCRWANHITQSNNTRSNQLVTVGKETLTLMQWSRRTGIKFSTLRWRLNRWTPEKSIRTAVRHKKSKSTCILRTFHLQ